MGAITVGFVPISFYFYLNIYKVYQYSLYAIKTIAQLSTIIRNLQRNNNKNKLTNNEKDFYDICLSGNSII